MRRFDTSGAAKDYLSESEARQLEDGLRVLARINARAVMKERSFIGESQHDGFRHPPVHAYGSTAEGRPDESLTLSVAETAKMLGLSRASAYQAIHTGQIPGIKLGRRVFVPRVALNRMISKADNYESRGVQHSWPAVLTIVQSWSLFTGQNAGASS